MRWTQHLHRLALVASPCVGLWLLYLQCTTDIDCITPTIPRKSHPIPSLIRAAEGRWEALLARQSTSLADAIQEYRLRYRRNPPRGFDVWYEWARERDFKLIDEFDPIEADLAPFWGLSAAQIAERTKELADLACNRILMMQIRDGRVTDDGGAASVTHWEINRHYYKIVEPFARYLPDMDLPIGIFDNPIVFVSYEERQRLIKAGRAGTYAPDEEEIPMPAEEAAKDPAGFGFIDVRQACHPQSPARQYITGLFGDDEYATEEHALEFRFPPDLGSFVYDVKRQSDVCTNPALGSQHGAFIKSAISLPALKRNRLYPVFSWSRVPSSSDITVPVFFRWVDDPGRLYDWEDMESKISWRGRLTGIWPDETVDYWSSQRHKLATTVQKRTDHVHFLRIHPDTSELYLASAPAATANDAWVDVAPVDPPTPRSKADRDINRQISFSDQYGTDDRNRYKALLDVDGYGWSARFRELMMTNSAVVKTTAFREFFSDWLIPWYHYIPINYHYDDLYSVLAYFFGNPRTGAEAHDDELRRFGDRSRDWVKEHARQSDHLAYMFRLCLEWARLTSLTEERSSMDLVY